MAMRISGLASGLDTDSMVKELMMAHSLKKTNIEKKKTRAEWTQDKWKELNSKIYKIAKAFKNYRIVFTYFHSCFFLAFML